MDGGRLALGVGDHGVVALLLQIQIVEEDASRLVTCAGEGDDTAGRLGSTGGKQGGLDQVEEQEVAEVVGAKLSLETIDGATLGDRHDTSVQHEDIKTLLLIEELLGCFPDALEVVQLQADQDGLLTAGVACDECIRHSLAFGEVTACEVELCAGGVKDASSLVTETGRCSSDQDDLVLQLALEAKIFHNVCGRWASCRPIDVSFGVRLVGRAGVRHGGLVAVMVLWVMVLW